MILVKSLIEQNLFVAIWLCLIFSYPAWRVFIFFCQILFAFCRDLIFIPIFYSNSYFSSNVYKSKYAFFNHYSEIKCKYQDMQLDAILYDLNHRIEKIENEKAALEGKE